MLPMDSFRRALTSLPLTFSLAVHGVRSWTSRQIITAAAVAIAFGVLLGLATVLIPNPVFSREIPPVWWNYPVWILTSVFSGMLFATYVRSADGPSLSECSPSESSPSEGVAPESDDDEAEARRSSRLGLAGAFLAWFAVGCPVCNKLALLALGYSGAITWFAPFQPVLAIMALLLTGVALVVRLRGQVACVLPAVRVEEPAK